MLKISAIENNSVGKELKLNIGYKILSFNGFPAVDILDYLYYDAQSSFNMVVETPNGQEYVFNIEKDDDETLGLSFEDDGLAIKTCQNNCIFCFVRQMPNGLRESLYVKDDDYRQSFLCGNFVTLTNVSESDLERIIRLNISPLYVSVHTMNGELRKQMLCNRFADKISKQIERLANGGITMQTQVVLVPSVNDGKELDYTVNELFKFYPNVQTVAVVPCGITKYREGLTKIDDITQEYALSVIGQCRKLNESLGVNFVQLADEFYNRAGIETEPYGFYGDFVQIENGVGMTAKFLEDFRSALEKRKYNKSFLTVTGTSAKDLIVKCCKTVETYCQGVRIDVLAVENEFFGKTVNCAGLVTGGDIITAVQNYQKPFDELVIPSVMLKETEDVFLDGITVKELSAKINKPIRINRDGGYGFFDVYTTEYEYE